MQAYFISHLPSLFFRKWNAKSKILMFTALYIKTTWLDLQVNCPWRWLSSNLISGRYLCYFISLVQKLKSGNLIRNTCHCFMTLLWFHLNVFSQEHLGSFYDFLLYNRNKVDGIDEISRYWNIIMHMFINIYHVIWLRMCLSYCLLIGKQSLCIFLYCIS